MSGALKRPTLAPPRAARGGGTNRRTRPSHGGSLRRVRALRRAIHLRTPRSVSLAASAYHLRRLGVPAPTLLRPLSTHFADSHRTSLARSCFIIASLLLHRTHAWPPRPSPSGNCPYACASVGHVAPHLSLPAASVRTRLTSPAPSSICGAADSEGAATSREAKFIEGNFSYFKRDFGTSRQTSKY